MVEKTAQVWREIVLATEGTLAGTVALEGGGPSDGVLHVVVESEVESDGLGRFVGSVQGDR